VCIFVGDHGVSLKSPHRNKVLALGVLRQCRAQLQVQGLDHSVSEIMILPVETAIECVQRGILTEMDGRDLPVSSDRKAL
jgi:hypothetical protein